MTDGSTVIGLFQGMFDKNTLTFNPGWGQDARNVDPFDDIRVIQADLESKGIEFFAKVDPASPAGPAHFMVFDPDGNPILVDQHR
jgi:hypothetical protein